MTTTADDANIENFKKGTDTFMSTLEDMSNRLKEIENELKNLSKEVDEIDEGLVQEENEFDEERADM